VVAPYPTWAMAVSPKRRMLSLNSKSIPLWPSNCLVVPVSLKCFITTTITLHTTYKLLRKQNEKNNNPAIHSFLNRILKSEKDIKK
jgi:hypothetical protein